MKKGIRFLLVTALFVVTAVAVQARRAPDSGPRARAARTAIDDNIFLSVGNLGALITNYGRFGDADSPRQSSMEWPLGSNNDYLFEGRLWFGTITNGPVVTQSDQILRWGTDQTASSDTIVVDTGPNARGDFDTHCTFTDLIVGATDAIGINVDQHTSTWTVSYLDDFILYDLTFTNVSGGDLEACYVGWAFDGDVSSQEGSENYLDDLTYYLRDDDLNRFISYEYDDDHPQIPGNDKGGPAGQSKGYLGSSPLLVIGPDGTEFNNSMPTNHYWWDWNHDPGTDDLRYEYLSSTEFLPVPPSPFDYRYLQSFGPFDMAAGETVRILAVHGVGEGLAGLTENLWAAHDLFEANAATFDDGKWLASGPPPAPALTVTPADGRVTLNWSDAGEDHVDPVTGVANDFAGYRVWRSNEGVEGTWTLLADFDALDDYGLNAGLPPKTDGMYEFVDTQVQNGFGYWYSVSVYDKGDLEAVGSLESSQNSNKVEVFPGPVGDATGDNIYVYPNPYRFQSTWDPTPGPQAPAANRVRFNNIPGQCTIRIYTMAGDLITEINHNDGTGYEDWNLMSDREQPQKIVSGIYLYNVQGDDVDYVGKFVVLR